MCIQGHKLWGFSIFVIILSLASYFFLFAANHYYVNRADYLLQQVRALKLDNSSIGTLKHLGSERGFRYEETPAEKFIDVPCLDYVFTNNGWLDSIFSRRMFAKLGKWAGLRPWFAVGDVEIRSGQVVGKVYAIQLDAIGNLPEFEASAWEENIPQLSVCNYYPMKRHPGYGFRNASNVRSFAALISPDASVENRKSAFEFNPKCLTRRVPCDKFSEIMPQAWADYEADAQWSETHEDNLVWQLGAPCPY